MAQLRYNYRVYPTPGQRIALSRAFGCARVVFNDGLSARREAHEARLPYIKDSDLQKQVITAAKATDDRRWLSEVSSVVLVQSLRDLHTAYRNFFNSATGKRRGPKVAPPRFKSRKDNRQSIRLTSNGFRLRDDGRLHVAKIGELKVMWSRGLPSEPKFVTITKEPTGQYYVSFVVEVEPSVLPEVDADTGIDLGLTHFAILSDGRKVDSPKFLRQAERKLKRLQKSLSRKQKGSANRGKERVKVARQHATVAHRRRDWHHKESTRVIRDNQAVYVEKLPVSGLGRTRLAKSVHDAGWSQFVNMLEYKAALCGRVFAKVDPAYTSQICSACGVLDGPKPLSVREWICAECHTVHDRDINAANNILAAGRAERLNARGAQIRPVHVPAPRRETGTHRYPQPAGSRKPGPSGPEGRQLTPGMRRDRSRG